MARLIKMDFIRLLHSKVFWISAGIIFVIQCAINFSTPLVANWLMDFAKKGDQFKPIVVTFSSFLSGPLMQFFIIFMYLSAVSFLYADIANGYVKNIAGQISKKGYTAVSKMIVLVFHNFVFLLLGALGLMLGSMLSPSAHVVFDGNIPYAVGVFFIKLLLSLALCSILLIVTMGLRSKSFAIVLGVLFSVGILSTLYMGINMLAQRLGLANFDITKFVPDQLFFAEMNNANDLLIAFAAAVVFIAVFTTLTVNIFNKTDVK